MPKNQNNKRGELFIKAVNSLGLESPVTEISEKIRYDKGNLSRILSGKLQPSKNVVQNFEKHYNICIDDFENVKDEEIEEKDIKYESNYRFEDVVAKKVSLLFKEDFEKLEDKVDNCLFLLEAITGIIKHSSHTTNEIERQLKEVRRDTSESKKILTGKN